MLPTGLEQGLSYESMDAPKQIELNLAKPNAIDEAQVNEDNRIPAFEAKDCSDDGRFSYDHCDVKIDTDKHEVEQVALTVPTQDDPSLPVWTFRVWLLGLLSCASLAFINQFFQYRSEPMKISALSATLAALPLGHGLALALPTTTYAVFLPGRSRGLSFTLNPGPFNVKEHVLIAIFANAGNAFGYGGAFAIEMVNIIKIFFHLQISFLVALVLVLSSQMIGYGWAGLMRKQLIDPAYTWWPSTLVQVSLFRTLHEKSVEESLEHINSDEDRQKKQRRRRVRFGYGLTRSQVFYTVTAASFAYYVLPGYLVPWLSCMSLLCLVWPKSVVAQQLGSGFRGLGIGAFTLDWAAVSSFLGSPLIFPSSVLFNMLFGAGVMLYIVTPVLYYGVNAFRAQNFPIISHGLFRGDGTSYNVTQVLDQPAGQVAPELYLTAFFGVNLALHFAAPVSAVTQFILFHSKETLQFLLAIKSPENKKVDVHTRLMHRYPDIPRIWFLSILAICFVGVIVICVKFEEQVRTPWWGVVIACSIAAISTLPIGIIAATTNMTPSLMVVMQFLGGYLFPGSPIANQGMKLFGHMSMQQAIFFLQDFKLGHYMKIPPRSMFLVQVIGTIVAGSVNLGTAWWLYEDVAHLCNVDGKLSPGSAWTCPWDGVAYDTTIVWGLLGPKKTYGSQGPYKNMVYWATLIGGVGAPLVIWGLSRAFPGRAHWIKLINIPVVLGAAGWLPAAGTINYTSWFFVGFLFNFYIFRYHKAWWKRFNYILSAALDAGTAIMGILLSLFLGFRGISLDYWAAQKYSDHCPLSSCSLLHYRNSTLLPHCPLYH